MSISGIGQNYYHNNVATVRNTKNVNSTGKNDGFAGKVTEKNPVSPEDMTLEEYKAYFNEKMNSLYTHPSQRNRNDIIDITDAAYKRMQTDPEYEKKILDALAKNKAVNFGNYIPQISYMHIDDTSVNCHLFFSEVLALLLKLPDTLTVLIAFDIFISITSLENLFSI